MSKQTDLETEKKVVNDYLNRISVKEICNKYNISRETVRNIRLKNSIKTFRPDPNKIKEEVETLFKDGLNCADIAKKLNICRTTVSKCLFMLGYSDLQSYNTEKIRLVKSNKFLNLNDPNTMYWLGILATDGGLSSKKYSIQLGLKDLELIEQFTYFLEIKKDVIQTYKDKRFKDSTMFQVKFAHKEIYNTLISLGITPKKSFTLKVNFNIDYNFLRGVIDGNGCVSNGKAGNTVSIVTASKEFLNQLSDFLNKEGYKYSVHQRSNTYNLYIGRKDQIEKLYKNLYTDSTYFLSRKKQRFLDILGNDIV